MNIKDMVTTLKQGMSGLISLFSSAVILGIFSEIIFGSGAFGINVVSNLLELLNKFLAAGVVGLLGFVALLHFGQSIGDE